MSVQPTRVCCCGVFSPHSVHPDYCQVCSHNLRWHPPPALAHTDHHCGDCHRLSLKPANSSEMFIRHSDSLSRFVRLLQGAKEFTRKLPVTQAENVRDSKQSVVWSQRTRSTACESSPGATLTTQMTSSPVKSRPVRRALQSPQKRLREPLFSPDSVRHSRITDANQEVARSKSARLIRVTTKSPQSRSIDSIVPTLDLGRMRPHQKEVVSEYYPGMSVSRPATPRLVAYEDALLRLELLGVGHRGAVTGIEIVDNALWSVGTDYCLCRWELPEESTDPYLARNQTIGRVMAPNKKFRAHKGPINCINSIGTTRKFCTAACDGVIKIWSGTAQTGCIQSSQDIIQCISVGECLVAGARSGHLHRWDLTTLQAISPALMHEHYRCIRSVSYFNPLTVLTASDDRNVKLWDLRTQRSIASFSGHPDSVTSVVANLDLGFFAGTDCEVWQWDIRVNKVVETWKLSGPVQCLSLMKGWLLAGGQSIHIWQRRKQPMASSFHTGTVQSLRYFSSFLLSGSRDQCVCVWKVRN